jgi:ABC-type uncharacterized transport system substrate-binding protein
VLIGSAGEASAHPHIFVDATTTVVFDDQGRFLSIENVWTLDEAFFIWQIHGPDINGDGQTASAEMQDPA